MSSQSTTDSARSTDLTTPLPIPANEFLAMGVPAKVAAALFIADIVEPTKVQSAVIPDALAGHDVLGRAQTGSGKTLAFGIPVVARLAGSPSRFGRPRALVIVPTRELASQVTSSMEPIARAMRLRLTTVYGGAPYDKQIRAIRQGVDIVVATPGRLGDLIERGVIGTEDIEITVLDEADHLCDLGFYPEVDALLAKTPAEGQRLLLSATLDGDVDRLVKTHLRDPRRHEVDPNAGAVVTMDHHVLVVGGFGEKIMATADLIRANNRTIVFTRTRDGATELRSALAEHGIEAVDLHGNLTQRVRERNLDRFSTGRVQAVVATDVAARGIHVDGVRLVVHFDAPTDPKAYLHRSGRTARAGESGAVVTLTTRKRIDEVHRLQKQAKVTALIHDSRTAPQPMTLEALAVSDATEKAQASGPRAGAGKRTGGYPKKKYGSPSGAKRHDQHRSGKPEARASRDSRPGRDDARRNTNAAGQRSGGKKPRWNKADRPR